MAKGVCWFEIPTTDLNRAKSFYEAVFGVKLREMNVDNDHMFVFESSEELGVIGGAIFQAEGFNPSKDGVRIYFDGGDDLSQYLDKVESAGGNIIKPKTLIAEEIGYIADFIDTEGNLISLYSKG